MTPAGVRGRARQLAVIAGLSLVAGLGLQAAIAVPVAAAGSPSSHRSHPVIPGPSPSGNAQSTIRQLGWSAQNWSGYDINGAAGAYSAITGCWTVPSVSGAAGDPSYSSAWIGIDGGLFSGTDYDLIQTGTEQDWSGGSAQYSAWWEILPAAATTIYSMTVDPYDAMCASVTKGTSGDWTMSITDETNGGSATITRPYAGPGESAEWVVERPVVDGVFSTLADYGQTTLDPGTVNGANPDLVAADGGYMYNEADAQVSTPSNPDSDANGFSAEYGSTQPPPPPALLSVTPSSGSRSGGQSVTIGGSGFEPGDAVDFSSSPATGVQFVSPTELTALTPAGPAGSFSTVTVSVTVKNPTGPSSTEISAYTYVSPTPEAGWVGYQGLGSGPLGGQPHAISSGPGDLDVFWRGTDNGLWHEWYSGGQWNGPQELAPAGSLASDPSPVSSEAGVLDVFWKGTDGNLWHVWYQNGWHGPQSLGGGPLGSAPQPVSWGSGQIDVFWKGTDGNLWHMWYLNGWYGPQSLGGGPLLSTPHPVSWGVGNIDVFWEGPGETLVHEWYANGWQGPQNLGGAGTVASDPEPVSWGPGNIEVFWKGADGNLWQDYFANGWAGAASLGGPGGAGTLLSNPVPASSGVGLLNVFWQGEDGGLWEAYYRNGWVVGARMNEGTIGSPPSAATPPGQLDVFWEGTDHNLWYDHGG